MTAPSGPPDSVSSPAPGPGLDPAPRPATFSLDGRAAPGLYLVGWVATLMGLAVILVSFLSAGGGGGGSGWIFLGGLAALTVGFLAAGGSQALERTRSDSRYRGPSPVLAFAAVIALTLLAIVVVLAPLAAAGLDPRSPLATTLSLALTALVYAAVVRLLVVGSGALSWADMGLRLPLRAAARDLLLGALFAVPVLVVTLVLAALLARVLEPAPNPLPEMTTALALVANLVSAAVLAPVGEELFFRGFATTAWARTLGRNPAIVRGAAFFALAHVITLFDVSFASGAQRAVFSFVALLPVGVALGWLFLARRSLYASIGLHAAYNALQVLALWFATTAR